MNQYLYLTLRYKKICKPFQAYTIYIKIITSLRIGVSLQVLYNICSTAGTYNVKLWFGLPPAKIFRNSVVVVHTSSPSQSSDYEIGILAAKTACSRCPLAHVQNPKSPLSTLLQPFNNHHWHPLRLKVFIKSSLIHIRFWTVPPSVHFSTVYEISIKYIYL